MTGIIANSVYEYLEIASSRAESMQEKQTETKDQLLIDEMVLNDYKKRQYNLGMVWINYKKTYSMIPHYLILENLGLVQVSENIVKFIRKIMKNWNTSLTSVENIWQMLTSEGAYFRVTVRHHYYL